MKKPLLACALFLTSISATAADNPWLGTWKLDTAKSQFTGDTFTYSKTANGLMHYSDGSTISWDFGIDGKPYKAYHDQTTTWTAVGDNAWDAVISANGKELYRVHREVSVDGKTLTVHVTGAKPDGSAFNEETVYTRVTGTNGLVGKWRSTKANYTADTVVISSPTPGILRFDFPTYKESYEGKGDGTDRPLTGPTIPVGSTISFKRRSPTQFSYTVKNNGKAENLGIQTLAADGKSFTDVSWSPGKESEKSTGVYVKQ